MLIAILVVNSIVGAAIAVAPISTSELCDALEQQYAALDGKTVSFDVESYSGRGSPCMPVTGPPTGSLLRTDRWEVLHKGCSFRTERVTTTARDEDKETIGERQVRTWDGIEGRTIGFAPGAKQPRAAYLRKIPIEDPRVWDPSMTWLGWWVLETPTGESFVDLLKREGLAGPELLPDGRSRWRGNLYPQPSGPAEFILTARRTDNGVELCEVETRHYYDESRTDESRMVLSRWVFGPVRRDRGEVLASTAEVYGCLWRRGKPEDDVWGYTRVMLRQIAEPTLTETTFREPIGESKDIVDERYRIAYEQGGNYINVDGRILGTHEPVFGDQVGHNLEWWIQHGEWWPLDIDIKRSPVTKQQKAGNNDP